MITLLHDIAVISAVWVSLCLATPAKAQETPGLPCLAKLDFRKLEPCEEPKSPSPGLPLRTLGWLCGPNQDHCEGNFPIEAGSGGARVVAFYNQIRDRATKSINVDWRCPDSQYDVSITLRVNKRTWQARTRCSAEHYNGFSLKSLRGWEGGSAALVVQLLAGAKCTLPVYLSARMTTPEKYFIKRGGACRNLKSTDACLVIYSNFSSPDGWQIRAGDAIKAGDGRMDEVELRVQKPSECQPIDLSVDFPEREAQKIDGGKPTIVPTLQGRTYIGELRFQ